MPPADSARILSRPDGTSIAYHRSPGKGIDVVFIHGLMSDMAGGKALHVEAHCQAQGRPFVRFDQYGHGQSSGAFPDGCIGRWAEDTVAVLDHLTDGPQVLVGSSCGGWLMLLAALARPDRVAGLVGIAPAPDFTEDLSWPSLSAEQQEAVLREGRVEMPNPYSDQPYVYSKRLFDDGRRHLLLREPIPLSMPVRILHGQQDEAVPWQRSLTLMDRLAGADVEATFIKSGDHRLSEPADLERLSRTLDEVLAMVEEAQET